MKRKPNYCPATDGEVVVLLRDGTALVFPDAATNPDGVTYVRFLASDQKHELAYWESAEWRDAPEEVMGAIMGLLTQAMLPAVKE